METENHKHQHTAKGHSLHYKKLLLMAILSFIAMYVLMYAMVNSFANVLPNINQFYMAGLMASPMVVIEIIVMSAMYMNRRLNAIITGISVVALIVFFIGIRQQVGVSDKEFLKSMIPHHAGAILMCEEANIQDPEIKKLCEEIRSGQQREIDQMKAKLNELKK
jgi:type IV secretory pathway VirB2 component (pilin)